jgi:hypothetical protein
VDQCGSGHSIHFGSIDGIEGSLEIVVATKDVGTGNRISKMTFSHTWPSMEECHLWGSHAQTCKVVSKKIAELELLRRSFFIALCEFLNLLCLQVVETEARCCLRCGSDCVFLFVR